MTLGPNFKILIDLSLFKFHSGPKTISFGKGEQVRQN